MTTDTYRVFNMVAECGSISQAAEKLFVTQPAVSKAIRNLEESLDVQLFQRNPRGVELTAEGQVLYDHVQQAFKQLNEGERLMGQLKNREYGMIRIGISNTLCKYYFLPHLEAFHQHYPNLKIQIVNRTSMETLGMMEEGLLDCAVISEMAFSPKFLYHQLMTIHDIFVAGKEAPKTSMSLLDLEDEAMLLLERNNATRDHLEKFFQRSGVSLNVDIEISSMEFLVEFSKIGLGVASVIEEFVDKELSEKSLYRWPVVPEVPERSLGLIYERNRRHSIACQTFLDYMKKNG